MCKFLRKLFTKREILLEKKPGGDADAIRKFAKTEYVIPARQKGNKRVTFTAGDIHTGMGLVSRIPLVCSAISAKKFLTFARVGLIQRKGSKQGTATSWTFKVK
jgi:hypothetical protein